MKIIRGFNNEEDGDEIDPLLEAINGSGADDKE